MPRKLKPIKSKHARVHVLLRSDVIIKLDERAAALAAAVPGSTVTRTDVVRRAIHRYLDEEAQS